MAASEQEILEGLAEIVNEETGLDQGDVQLDLSLIHISEPTRPY